MKRVLAILMMLLSFVTYGCSNKAIDESENKESGVGEIVTPEEPKEEIPEVKEEVEDLYDARYAIEKGNIIVLIKNNSEETLSGFSISVKIMSGENVVKEDVIPANSDVNPGGEYSIARLLDVAEGSYDNIIVEVIE